MPTVKLARPTLARHFSRLRSSFLYRALPGRFPSRY